MLRVKSFALRSPAIALAVPLVAGLLSFGLLAAAYGRPPRSDLNAVTAVRELLRYRLVSSDIRLDGRPVVHAICWESWFRTKRHGHVRSRGAFVKLSDGSDYLVVRGAIRRLGGPRLAEPLVHAEVALAGCPRLLAQRIASALTFNPVFPRAEASLRLVDLEPRRVGRHPVHLELAIVGSNAQPSGLSYSAGSIRGTSRLRLVRLTRRIEHRLRREVRLRERLARRA